MLTPSGAMSAPGGMGAPGGSRAAEPEGTAGSRAAASEGPAGACSECLRDAWLLGQLSARLAYCARDPERLLGLLALSGEGLIQAIGGRWRESLRARYAQPEAAGLPAAAGVERICRHDSRYPRALERREDAPRVLHVAGGTARLETLLDAPTVAIVGTARASDYGMEVAHGLARALAASGITVVSALAEGVPAAAHLGALDAPGPTLTVAAGGVDVPHPVSWRALFGRLSADGCVVAELPCGCPARRWCHPARARTVAALARLVVVVEAGEDSGELLAARLAAAAGVVVAAVPGRVWAPGARGPHMLLREGAVLVRGPEDVLDALYGVGGTGAKGATGSRDAGGKARPALGPRLRAVLDEVGAGRDTVPRLTGGGTPEVLRALAELECTGVLVRGDRGRYLPTVGHTCCMLAGSQMEL
jgi:DNA processing protein